jgi:hypothetical protein
MAPRALVEPQARNPKIEGSILPLVWRVAKWQKNVFGKEKTHQLITSIDNFKEAGLQE